jgi:hypothetical protein
MFVFCPRLFHPSKHTDSHCPCTLRLPSKRPIDRRSGRFVLLRPHSSIESGTRVNGPKLIGCGLLLCACSSIMSGMPYFIYGPSSHLLSESDLQLDPAHSAMLSLNGVSSPAVLGAATATPSPPVPSSSQEFCGAGADDCKTNPHPFESGAFLFLVIASFVNGIGQFERKQPSNARELPVSQLTFFSFARFKDIPVSGPSACLTWTTT